MRVYTIRKVLICAIITSLSATSRAADSSAPACTLADINQALANDLTCSTDGTVFFGTDINQFIVSQCSGISTPGESSGALKQSKSLCIRCARKSAEAFKAAQKAGLIQATDSRVSLSEIKTLCNITDTGDGGDSGGGDSHPQSDALKAMFEQLHVCLPQTGQSVNPADCEQCGKNILDYAVSQGIITQAKEDVISNSLKRVCSGKTDEGDHGAEPTPTPAPGGSNSFDTFFGAVRSCLSQYHTPGNMNAQACLDCVGAIPTEGLNSDRLSQALSSITTYCQSSVVNQN